MRADEFARLQITRRFANARASKSGRRQAARSRAHPIICGNTPPSWSVRRTARPPNARRHRANSTLAIATSDHQVSFLRSSQGKSNSVASIMLVRSVETRSAQSKVSLRGSASSTSEVRLRISGSKLARWDGATIGATVRRCAVWPGGSIRMKFARSCPLRLIGDLDAAELGTGGIIRVIEFDRENVVVARHRPIRAERRGLAIMHGIVAAQLREQMAPGVVLIKPGIADIDRGQLALHGLRHPASLPSSVAVLTGRSAFRPYALSGPTRTNCLPKLAPFRRPMNAAGALSSPSVTNSGA